MAKLDGHCLCGRITYECEAEPIVTAICHCEDCQRQTGTSFSIVVGVPRDQLQIHGTPKVFETMGDDRGAPAYRHFCGDCGSPIISILADADEVAWIKAGTLRDKSWLSPTLEAWTQSAQPWVQEAAAAERPSFARSVPAA
jgi:hypothetical protein